MSDPTNQKFIDSVAAKVPIWMTRFVGFRFLATMIFLADMGVEILLQGLYARFPGVGTSTALPLIGRSRGMIRGMSDTDASFATRLKAWLDRWHQAGTQIGIGRAIQDYVANAPVVKVVNRAGVMTTIASDGSSTVDYASGWDWDSVSNPERAGFWSELWIIVYPSAWPIASSTFPTWYWGTDELGLGIQTPRVDVDAIRSLVSTWKAAHTFVRMVIFSFDAGNFDPATPASMPDGTWGRWSFGHSHRTQSGRFQNCRYMQPAPPPQIEA